MLYNQEQTQLILDSIPSLVFLKDNKNKILRVNSKVLDAFNLRRDEIEGKHSSEIFPEDAERFYADDLAVMDSKQPKLGYIEVAGKKWVRTDKIPIVSESGNVDQIVVIATDITDQMSTQQALKESELKYRTLYEESPVMHANVDPTNAAIKDCNQLFVERLGYPSKNEIIGKPVFSVYDDNCQAAVREAFDEFVATGRVHNRELALKRIDGTSVPVVLNVAAVKDDDGKILYSSSTWVDITELKKHTIELERANRDLEEFSYVASHDLKAPLRAIDNLATWLSEDLGDQLPEESAKHIAQLKQRIGRMETLLNDLLDYSRAGRKPGRHSKANIQQLVNETLALSDTNNFNIHQKLHVSELTCLKTPLKTVLRNLINNAVKHHDQVHGTISIETLDSDSFVQFVVGDDGPGIDEHLYEKAFTMFQTLQPRDEVEGSGMGLAIVKKLVELQGGRIWIEPNRPRGTRFCFTWPKSAELN